jgi:hypothetical protein
MGVDVSVDFPELEQIKQAFSNLSPSLSSRYMGTALKKTLEPSRALLKTLTPRGPTGNLQRAIAPVVVRKYSAGPKSKNPAKSPGAAVALLGYKKAPRGRRGADDTDNTKKGSHAGFLEFGTKQRRTRGYIASSFRRSGPVRFKRFASSGRISVTPKPPKGFVKAVKKGDTVDLGRFPIGGSTGLPPVRTAFQRSLGRIRSVLPLEMTKALQSALRDKFGPFGKRKT